MRLFFNSKTFTTPERDAFSNLVGKPIGEISVGFVTNARDLKPPLPEGYRGTKEEVAEAVGQLEEIDLRGYIGKPAELKQRIGSFDVLWLGGGNTYYLRYILSEVGFEPIIRELLNRDLVLAGTSAGAIVAGPTLKYFDKMDDPSNPPKLIEEGLGLIDFVIIPHWDDPKHTGLPRQVRHELLTNTGFETLPLNDGQAVVINGDKRTIVR